MNETYSVAAYFAAVTTRYKHTEERTVTLKKGLTIAQARELTLVLQSKNGKSVARMLSITHEQAAQLQGASRYFIPELENE